MTWASVQQVEDITGVVVSAQRLAQASAAITIYCNRTPEASAGISSRDLYWLTQATSWQSVWEGMQASPEGRQVVRSFSQDGMSATYPADWAVALAPLAARALKNLSWKGSTTRRVLPVEVPPGLSGVVDFPLESSDGDHEWEPL